MNYYKEPNPYKGQIIEYQGQLYYRIDEKHFFKISEGNKILAGEFAQEIDVEDYVIKDNIEVTFEPSPSSELLSVIWYDIPKREKDKLKSYNNYPNYTEKENGIIEYRLKKFDKKDLCSWFIKEDIDEEATIYETVFNKYIPLQIDDDYYHMYNVKENRLETRFIV